MELLRYISLRPALPIANFLHQSSNALSILIPLFSQPGNNPYRRVLSVQTCGKLLPPFPKILLQHMGFKDEGVKLPLQLFDKRGNALLGR